jgi:membrane fusion protein, multidrug efflux system
MNCTMNAPRQKNDKSSTMDVAAANFTLNKVRQPIRPRQTLIVVAATMMVVAMGFAGFLILRAVGAKGSRSEVTLPSVTPVRVYVVGSRNANATGQMLTGVVRPRHETQLAFRVGGKIKTRHVEVGQTVSKGDLLFELDPEDYRLQVENAEANLEVARAAVQRSGAEEKRLAELLAARATSPAEYERALADRDISVGQRQSSERQLELAKNQLAYCRLVADEAGVITDIDVEAGQVVSAGGRLGSLAQTNEIEAVIDIPENRIPADTGMETKVQFWSLPGQAVSAKLREISPIADSVTRTFQARFTLVMPPPEVKIGMTTSVVLNNGETAHTWLIPLPSVFTRNDQASVWLLDEKESSIRAQPVSITKYGNENVFIASGLNRGDKIISAGVQKLDESLRVRIWEIQQ